MTILSDIDRKLAGYDFHECRAWGHKWVSRKDDGLWLQPGKPNTATLKHVGRVSTCATCNATRIAQFEIVLWHSGEIKFVRRKPTVYAYPDGYKIEDVNAVDVRSASRAALIQEFLR